MPVMGALLSDAAALGQPKKSCFFYVADEQQWPDVTDVERISILFLHKPPCRVPSASSRCSSCLAARVAMGSITLFLERY